MSICLLTGLEVFPAAQSGPGYMYCVKMWCRAGFICSPAQSVGGVNTTLLKQGRGQLYDIIPIWLCWIKTRQTLLLTDLSVTSNDKVKCLKFQAAKKHKNKSILYATWGITCVNLAFYSLLFLIYYYYLLVTQFKAIKMSVMGSSTFNY